MPIKPYATSCLLLRRTQIMIRISHRIAKDAFKQGHARLSLYRTPMERSLVFGEVPDRVIRRNAKIGNKINLKVIYICTLSSVV